MHHIHVNDDDRSRPSPGLDFQVPELGGEACLLFDLPSARALARPVHPVPSQLCVLVREDRRVCQLSWSCASRLGRSVPGGRICVLLLRPRSSLAGLPPAEDDFIIHFNNGDTAAATRA